MIENDYSCNFIFSLTPLAVSRQARSTWNVIKLRPRSRDVHAPDSGATWHTPEPISECAGDSNWSTSPIPVPVDTEFPHSKPLWSDRLAYWLRQLCPNPNYHVLYMLCMYYVAYNVHCTPRLEWHKYFDLAVGLPSSLRREKSFLF